MGTGIRMQMGIGIGLDFSLSDLEHLSVNYLDPGGMSGSCVLSESLSAKGQILHTNSPGCANAAVTDLSAEWVSVCLYGRAGRCRWWW